MGRILSCSASFEGRGDLAFRRAPGGRVELVRFADDQNGHVVAVFPLDRAELLDIEQIATLSQIALDMQQPPGADPLDPVSAALESGPGGAPSGMFSPSRPAPSSKRRGA